MTTIVKPGRSSGSLGELLVRYRRLYQPSETKSGGPRGPHPGDVLYWVGCVGAISALLFFSTR